MKEASFNRICGVCVAVVILLVLWSMSVIAAIVWMILVLGVITVGRMLDQLDNK